MARDCTDVINGLQRRLGLIAQGHPACIFLSPLDAEIAPRAGAA